MPGKLVFVGLGLHDETDISLKALAELKRCNKIYAEFYTARFSEKAISNLEAMIGKKIKVLDRATVEKGELILKSALKEATAFLVVGDALAATTHIDLRLRAIQLGIETKVIHNASIMVAAISIAGLQHYKIGRTTTIPFMDEKFQPTSPYEVIANNKKAGLHTLVLLDSNPEKGCMSANEAMKILLELENKCKRYAFTQDTIVCVVARVGSEKPLVCAGKVKNLINMDFGEPMHTLVVPGHLHFKELEALQTIGGLKKD